MRAGAARAGETPNHGSAKRIADIIFFGGNQNESKTVCEAYVRQMQSHQEKRQGHGHLFQEQEPQAKTGLTFENNLMRGGAATFRFSAAGAREWHINKKNTIKNPNGGQKDKWHVLPV